MNYLKLKNAGKMSKTKILIDKKDKKRALITDTIPGDIPLIFSNEGFYKNISDVSVFSDEFNKIVECFVSSNSENYTIPYRYLISKGHDSYREISLCHPKGQLDICEFYAEYNSSITYYCAKSKFSIRYPERVGSSYYVDTKESNINKYKNQTIDTCNIDKISKHPSSYFSYNGYRRLHQFINSEYFNNIEKTFPVLWEADVSSCFPSIYTHSMSWVTKDILHSKENISSLNFGNKFDKLTQSINFNETKGICIGPEFSRIFAEIILQYSDKELLKSLEDLDLHVGVQYQIARYVDNYYIFTRNESIANTVYGLLQQKLSDIKLHLNESKLVKSLRPFQTGRSNAILRLNEVMECIYMEIKKARRPEGISASKRRRFENSIINKIKNICSETNVNYSEVSPYMIASINNAVDEIIRAHALDDNENKENHITLLISLIKISDFVFNVFSSVSSSLDYCSIQLKVAEFVGEHQVELLEEVKEIVYENIRSSMVLYSQLGAERSVVGVPIERMNPIVMLKYVAGEHSLPSKMIEDVLYQDKSIDYFKDICCLYVIGNSAEYVRIREKISKKIENHFRTKEKIKKSSEDAHLFFDAISCPFLKASVREAIIEAVYKKHIDANVTEAAISNIANEALRYYWFVNWEKINLLRAIEKKKLLSVY